MIDRGLDMSSASRCSISIGTLFGPYVLRGSKDESIVLISCASQFSKTNELFRGFLRKSL